MPELPTVEAIPITPRPDPTPTPTPKPLTPADGLEFYKTLTEEEKKFLAVVAGESLSADVNEQKAVASSIINRIVVHEWSNKSLTEILEQGYDAYEKNLYNDAMDYMESGIWEDSINREKFDQLVAEGHPIYMGEDSTDYANGAVFFADQRYFFHGDVETEDGGFINKRAVVIFDSVGYIYKELDIYG